VSRGFASAALFAVLIGGATTSAASSKPWTARRPPITPPAAHQLRDLARWPSEPDEPKQIDPIRFRLSVDHLCARDNQQLKSGGKAPIPTDAQNADAATGHPLGDLVLAAAAEAGVDPFLLAGLMFEQSACRAGFSSPLGKGLLKIHPDMYRSPGAPPAPGEKADWTQSALIDANFGGVPHRGPISHFIWGDVVRGSGCEDQALTARRRMIAFYLQTPEQTTKTTWGVTFVSPLEGTPRVASSGPGEDRAGGKRRHRGIDLAAALGEPVRSVADGTVIFAGANLPSAPRRAIPPSKIRGYRWKRLGAGGIYICIEHAPERHIVTCYMHLDTYFITEGDTVTAGQEIGRVGRTGVQVSPPHLHFELRIDDRVVDPARHLAALVIPPRATQTYRIVMKAKRLKVAKARNDKQAAQKL
jgi:murein DD-endopeptidase MepM/ murein hydrolase activator NlpD